MRYLIIIERTNSGFSAYSPDLPGCAATGATRGEVERAMREAVELHLKGSGPAANRSRRQVHRLRMWKLRRRRSAAA